MNKGTLVGIVAVLIGIADSFMSTLDHLRFRAYNTLNNGFCQVLMRGGCHSAHTSKWAEVFGIPISIYGLGFYFTLLTLLVLAAFKKGWNRHVLRIGLGISGISLLYCVFLAYILYRSGNFCPLCGILYAVNLTLTVIFYWQIRQNKISLFKGLHQTILSIPTIVALLVFVVFTGSGALLYGRALRDIRQNRTHNRVVNKPLTALPSHGPADSYIKVLEVSDFLCPYCARFFFDLEAVASRYEPHPRISYLFYPLDTCNPDVGRPFHASACISAAAALCAEQSGKFWEFAALLYKNRHVHTSRELADFAVRLGIPKQGFMTCLNNPATMKQVKKRIQQARNIGVKGTPTFVVNGKVFVGARSRAFLRKLFDKIRKNHATAGRKKD